jgi:hypothetical protein
MQLENTQVVGEVPVPGLTPRDLHSGGHQRLIATSVQISRETGGILGAPGYPSTAQPDRRRSGQHTLTDRKDFPWRVDS